MSINTNKFYKDTDAAAGGGADAKKDKKSKKKGWLVCHGATCMCDGAVVPQTTLKVINTKEQYVNDTDGASKLIATDAEKTVASLNFGNCKSKDSKNPPPCNAQLVWSKVYENVLIDNKNKILLHSSEAKCSFGPGKVIILKHGQEAEATAADAATANSAALPAANPLLTEDDIKNIKGENMDFAGATVSSIKINNTFPFYKPGEPVDLMVSSFKTTPTEEEKQAINWAVYDSKKNIIQTYTDKGTALQHSFAEPGTYYIGAYGKDDNPSSATTTKRIEVKENKFTGIAASIASGTKHRVGDTVHFSLDNTYAKRPGEPSLPNFKKIEWRVTSAGEGLVASGIDTGIAGFTVTCITTGTFTVTAVVDGTAIGNGNVIHNIVKQYITKVAVKTKTTALVNEKIIVHTTGFNIMPALPQELSQIKWIVFNDKNESVKESAGGADFEFASAKEGKFFIEAYLLRHGNGDNAKAVAGVQVEITIPAVIDAGWYDSKMGEKVKTGFDEEVILFVRTKSFSKKRVAIDIFRKDKQGTLDNNPIAKIAEVITNEKGDIWQRIKIDNSWKARVHKDDKLFVKIKSAEADMPFKNNTFLYPHNGKAELTVTIAEQIEYKGIFTDKDQYNSKSVVAKYGQGILVKIQTRNLSTKRVKIKVYRMDVQGWLPGGNSRANDNEVASGMVNIDAEGLAFYNFTIPESWADDKTKGDYYYFDITEDESGGTYITTEKPGDKAQNVLKAIPKAGLVGVHNAPVGVEQGGADKKEKCPRCEEKITVAELKEIFTDATDELAGKIVSEFNLYAIKFKINTCQRKAHFWAQARQESGSDFLGAINGERLNYTAVKLKSGSPFSYFGKHPEEADLYGRIDKAKNNDALIQKANQVMIANLAYADENRDIKYRLGNNQLGDGWRFRGRGILQITGRSNYESQQNIINIVLGKETVNIINENNESDTGFSAKQAVVSGLADWYNKNCSATADQGNKPANVDRITTIINAATDDASRNNRKSFFNKAKDVFKIKECPFANGIVPFIATDMLTYRIYHDHRIEFHIPKLIKKGFEGKYKYLYCDLNKKEHEICIIEFSEINGMGTGLHVSSIPKGYTSTVEYEGVDAKTSYQYADGSVITEGKKFSQIDYKIQYLPTGSKVKVVRMKDSLNYDAGGIAIKYDFSSSQRRFCGPKEYAAFIGALAECSFAESMTTTGSAYGDGTCFPSVAHNNGMSIDTSYISNHSKEQKFITAMHNFDFTENFVGKLMKYKNAKSDSSGLHDSHLHSGENNIEVKIAKEK